MDILNVLGTLPNINLVCPSYIADLEFGGQIPNYRNEVVQEWTCIDPDLASFSERAHNRFFTGARRYTFNSADEVMVIKGPPSKFFVWESEKQRDLYKQLKAALKGLGKKDPEYKERLNTFRENHPNQGEDFIYDYCQWPQNTNPAIIVAEDRDFAERFTSFNSHRYAKTTTAQGRGISVCCAKDFLDAINNAYEGKLASELKQFGAGDVGDTSYKAILDAHHINHKKQPPNGYYSLFKYVHGIAEDGKPEATLENVIRAGIVEITKAKHRLPDISPEDVHGVQTQRVLTERGFKRTEPFSAFSVHEIKIVRE